jgi:hypothetical protein
MRASVVVNCQFALRPLRLRRCSQAERRCWRAVRSPMRAVKVARQHAQFNFRHVEPGTMFGRVVDFEPIRQAFRLVRRKHFVKTGWLVRVELAHD